MARYVGRKELNRAKWRPFQPRITIRKTDALDSLYRVLAYV